MTVGVVGVSGEAQPTTGPGWNRGPSLVSALWRYRWAVLAVTLISAFAGFIYTAVRPPVFEASGRVIVTSPHDRTLFRNERGVPFVDMARYLDTQADQMTSPDVLARAAELLEGRFRPRQLQMLVEAESSPTTFALTVRARHEEPSTAADVVNAVIQAYQDVEAAQVQAQLEASVAQLAALQADIQQRLDALNAEQGDPGVQGERDRLSNELAELQTRAGQVRVDAAVYGAGIERTEPAIVPEQPASETPRRMAALFGLLGFLAALIVAFWRSERIQVIASPDDAAAVVDAPLVGVLSTRQADTLTAAATVVTAPDSSQAREHQIIASKVALLGGESEPRVVLVTSPEDTSGKSVTALNLALSAALDHRAVILADVDAAGRLTGLLGADDKCGVSDLIARSTDGDVGDCVAAVEELSAVDGFRFIPVGTAAGGGARGISGTPQLAKLLARLLQETDLIVLDGPPLLRAPTATRLAADTDGVVVMVVDRGTRSEDLRKAAGLIQLAKASFVGYVFDRSRRPRRWWPWPRRRTRSVEGRPAT
jgi:Mrp family chromosome partitioning ATPase/capsular polysaccharide biosynthesis protein